MSDQLDRVIRSLRHLWAQPDATIEQFAAEAVAALRPELEDAERWRAREAFLSPGRKEPLPTYGDRFPLSETLPGGDGDAYWATETHYYPRAPRNKRPEDATQIIYFSK